MKVYKDKEHSVSVRPFSWQGRRYLMVCVGLYAVFDPENGRSSLGGEQDFWKAAPDAFAAIGRPPMLDEGLPKTRAEVLVAGLCRTPGKKPLPALEVAFRVGPVRRRIAVFGDRQRLPGGGLSDPLPFVSLPLTWERAFGGPEFPANPEGRGLDKGNKTAARVPNLEDPDNFLLSGEDRPAPVCPFPLDPGNPLRHALSGTYDRQWRETRWPAYPDDLNPDFFQSAQQAQRFAPGPGESPFFRGDEEIEISGMSHEFPLIRSRLPEARVRAFVTTTETFTPFAPVDETARDGRKNPLPYAKDLTRAGLFQEVELHPDTVWLLPDLPGAFVLRRGLLPVADDEMDDVLRVFVVTERPAQAPKSLAYYLEEQKKRMSPSVGVDLAPLAEAGAKTAKAVKKARDLPKFFAKIGRDMCGQSPAMPLSMGDIAHSAGKTIAQSRATLDTLEKQMLALRERFSHLMSFDLSVFPRMRANLDGQEKNLELTLRRAEASLRAAEKKTKEAVAGMREQIKGSALPRQSPLAAPDELLARLDGLSPEGAICAPQPLHPWHDRGFALLLAARRALRRNAPLLARLAAAGLEEKTLEEAWIGYAAEALADAPAQWGLNGAEHPAGIALPAGLYVPRFAGPELTALRVYPLGPVTGPLDWPLNGPSEDAIALVPGSDPAPLSLPAAHPGGAVCVAPEDLSARFAEQEIGDFCHIVAAADPSALAAVKDLPPLLPDEGGLALIVLLPPGEAGRTRFAPWRKALPSALPLPLPEDCPHVLALAGQGRGLRRLVLDALPPELARRHDFDIPLPPVDKPPQPFSLNLPLPGKEEVRGNVEKLIAAVRAHFPDPQTVLAEELGKARETTLALLRSPEVPPAMGAEMTKKFEAAFASALRPPSGEAPPATVAGAMAQGFAAIARLRTSLPGDPASEAGRTFSAALDAAEKKTAALGKRLAPLDELRERSLAELEALGKGDAPEKVKAAFAAKGLDPDALKKPTREEVEAELAGRKNFSRSNLQELDLSGLDFSGADLSHALCAKAKFRGCRMDGADFTFTLANEADFSGATLRGARFKQTVLQKAVLREADFTGARLELTTLGECEATGTVFARADVKLCIFNKSVLEGANFSEASLHLCAFNGGQAKGADFGKVRAFKCLFRNLDLAGVNFRAATLTECLFQGAEAAGLSFAGADLRKFHADGETDLSRADFSGADMREASLRLSRLCGADFYRADLGDALIAQCDLDGARLDGLRAQGCRFVKCDLNRADLSGTDLYQGSLRKCRLTGADLSGASLYATDLRHLIINGDTGFVGTNCKRTLLEGQEEVLRDVARRNS